MQTCRIHGIMIIMAAVIGASGCSTVPVTGRSQLNIIPAGEMMAMSAQQYGDFLKSHPLSKDRKSADLVQRVGTRIQKAVETYMAQQNLSQHLAGYQWQFNLVESKDVNAWCMPGGRVVVYTGILPVTRDESGLAVVMGHEIAHAIAEHGSERMSQGLLAQLGGVALAEALRTKSAQTQVLWMGAYGLGAQYGVMMPFSRTHESEADRLGLVFMAMAGYDPQVAVDFWTRMSKSGGSKPPEFMSTHPSDERRIRDIQAALPEALKYYQP